MTGALFMPALFSAENGEITFDGKRVPIGKVIDAREFALRQAMNLRNSPRVLACWDAVFESARLAIEAARLQRRSSLRVVSQSNTPHAA